MLKQLIAVAITAWALAGCTSTPGNFDLNAESVSIADRLITQWGTTAPKNPHPAKVLLLKPDISLVFTDSMIKKLMVDFIGNGLRIPLKNSKLEGMNNSFIVLQAVKQFKANKQGFIQVSISGKAVLNGIIARKTIELKDMRIHSVPYLEKSGDRYFLIPFSVVSYLDLDRVPPELEKALVNLINDLLHKEKFAKKLRFDVTELVNPAIKHPFNSRNINLSLQKVAIVVQENRLLIQAKR